MPPSFVHLHLHSEFSLTDSTLRLAALVQRCAELGLPAVGVTDTSNLFALVKFYKAAESAGLKPVCGADVFVAEDGQVIGGSRYHGYNAEVSEIEIGWTFLARAYWGGKYNGEMKELMLRHAFTFVDRVIFLIGAENYRSRRAVEKIGAVPAGTRIDGYGRERLAFEMTPAMFDST